MQFHNSTRKSLTFNVIYIYTIPNCPSFAGYCKIGKTSIDALSQDWNDISQEEIDKVARNRIKEINSTAGLTAVLEYATIAIRKNNEIFSRFSDTDFHAELRNNNIKNITPTNNDDVKINEKVCKAYGREWFKISPHDAISFLEQFKNGGKNFAKKYNDKIILRSEQQAASDAITKAWNEVNNRVANLDDQSCNKFLLNAIMRYGKCITTYEFICENSIKKTLILTHRPVVKSSWFDDFGKFFNNDIDPARKEKNYNFLSKENTQDDDYKKYKNKNLIYFASIQDLRGLDYEKNDDNSFKYDDDGYKIPKYDENGDLSFKQSNQDIFETDWDLVVIDEAHEGNFTTLAERMHSSIRKKFTLYLSGTPFNIMYQDDFEKNFKNNVYSFGQLEEFTAKQNWSRDHGTDPSPYDNRPDIHIKGISISKGGLKEATTATSFENNYFDFNLFFQLDEDNNFVNESEIILWLDNISSDVKNDVWLENMPFHVSNRFQSKHSIWYLPIGIKKSEALQSLLEKHKFFREYKIFNVCGDNYSPKLFDEILDYSNKENKYSITLTIGRLTQGVTVPGWTTILLLNNIVSPMSYFQSIFRVKSSSPESWVTQKTCAQVFDFNPDRMLDLVDKIVKADQQVMQDHNNYEKVLREIVNYYNVMIFKDNNFVHVDNKILLDSLSRIKINRIIDAGFQSRDLIDWDRIKLDKNLSSEEIDKMSGELDKVDIKINKSGTPSKSNKITDNGLDEKIFKALESDFDKMTKEEADKSVTRNKKIKQLKDRIRTSITTIMTRIPFMLIGKFNFICGKYKNSLENLTPEIFCSFFDDEDWKEIMLKYEKKDFKNAFEMFVNIRFFNRVCEHYIAKISSISEVVNPLERKEMWIELFSKIHNPDSETVLTPWRVVEAQYELMELDWNEIYDKNRKFVDINSKSAFYPLYAACKLYEEQLKYGVKDWRNIIFHRIFAICRTNLTRDVAQLVLNFKTIDKNIVKHDILLEHCINKKYKDFDFKKISEEIMKKFDQSKLKFDYCVSNPPYQLPIISDKISDNKASANNIYNKFVMIGKDIANVCCMIFPAKWMTGGKGLKDFRNETLNSKHIKHLIDCENYKQLFPTISLQSGLTIMLIDSTREYDLTKISYLKDFKITGTVERKLNEYDVLVIDTNKYKILKTIEKKLGIKSVEDWNHFDTMDKRVSSQNPFGLATNFYKDENLSIDISDKYDKFHNIKIYYIATNTEHKNINSKNNRTFSFINEKEILQNNQLLDKYKVCIPKARGGDRDDKTILSKTLISEPRSICSESFVICGSFMTFREAIMFSYFMESRTLRFLVSIRKLTHDALRKVYKFVPYIDVITQITKWQNEPDDKKRTALDMEIMQYLGLSDEQQKFIFNSVKEMNNDIGFNIDEAGNED